MVQTFIILFVAKILLLSYQCFHNSAASYLTELLTILYKLERNLRSGKKTLYMYVVPSVLTIKDLW